MAIVTDFIERHAITFHACFIISFLTCIVCWNAEVIAGAVANALRERLPREGLASHSILASRRERNPYEMASDIKRARFSPPSMFQAVRNRRKQKHGQASKVLSYVRDIILLPMEFRSRTGEISIPRSTRRSKLGLVGKIEIDSSMTDQDVRKEICEVFASPMGLANKDQFFPFTYLQRAGSGSRSLCLPSVKESFQ